jgi:acyl carrier protein
MSVLHAASLQSGSMEAEVRAVLAEIARGLGYRGTLAPEQRLVEDLRLDSVGLLTLAVEVEDRFLVCLDADDEAGIRTVGDLERVLLRKLAPRAVEERR